MKKMMIAGLVLALSLLLASCVRRQPAPPPAPPTVDEATEAPEETTAAYQEAFSRLSGGPEGFLRRVLAENGLVSSLEEGGSAPLLLDEGYEGDVVSLPAGDHPGTSVVLDKPSLAFSSEASFDALTIKRVAETPVVLKGRVREISVLGDAVTLEISGGADTVFVSGNRCTLRLTGAPVGAVLTRNDALLLQNDTSAEVAVVYETGARVWVLPGRTFGGTE